MKYEFKPSFDRSIKSLPLPDNEEFLRACLEFFDIMERRFPMASGIGLKRLRYDYWEIRIGIRNRILFRWNEGVIEFILAGSHDSIKRFLKNL